MYINLASVSDIRLLPVVVWSLAMKLVQSNYRGYRGGSPTTVQAWQPCPLWEPSPSHPILL